jgi:hypothetical protein
MWLRTLTAYSSSQVAAVSFASGRPREMPTLSTSPSRPPSRSARAARRRDGARIAHVGDFCPGGAALASACDRSERDVVCISMKFESNFIEKSAGESANIACIDGCSQP